MTDDIASNAGSTDPSAPTEAEERLEEDLEPGGEGRTFADLGVRTQVEQQGDTDHPTGDGTGEV